MSGVEMSRLPAIDLSLFDIGDPWRDHVAAQVDGAAGTRGVFQILGHGIDTSLIDTLLELGGKYLQRLPRSEQAVAPGRAAGASWDSLRCPTSHLRRFVGFPPLRFGHAPVTDLPEFQETVREYTTTLTGLSHKLMAAMARGLRLDDGFFADHYTGAGSGTVNTCFKTETFAVEGELRDYRSIADSGNVMHRRFCPTCGTHLFSEAESRPHLVFVRVGTLDDPAAVRPAMTIWTSEAPEWACFDATVPKVERQPPPAA